MATYQTEDGEWTVGDTRVDIPRTGTSEGESLRLQVFYGNEKTVYLTVDCPNCNADNNIQHDMTNEPDLNDGSALYRCTSCDEEFYLHAACIVRWEATKIWKR